MHKFFIVMLVVFSAAGCSSGSLEAEGLAKAYSCTRTVVVANNHTPLWRIVDDTLPVEAKNSFFDKSSTKEWKRLIISRTGGYYDNFVPSGTKIKIPASC